MEALNRSSDGTDGSHALAAGFKARSGGQSGRSRGHGSRNGGGRGKRDGKGRLPNQRHPTISATGTAIAVPAVSAATSAAAARTFRGMGSITRLF